MNDPSRLVAPVLVAALFAASAFSADLTPRAVPDGVLFQVRAPGESEVYLAGDFNRWGRNMFGEVTIETAKMEGPDAEGIFRKVVPLEPGEVRFRYVLGGREDGWTAPEGVASLDGDGNAIIRIATDGTVHFDRGPDASWAPTPVPGGIRFSLHAPDAHVVFLAGEFNQWAENRDGRVVDQAHALRGPDERGVWTITVPIPPGRYRYQFVVDGDRWIPDPQAHEQDGPDHSILEVLP